MLPSPLSTGERGGRNVNGATMTDTEKPVEAATPAPETPAMPEKPTGVQRQRDKAAARQKPRETKRPPSLEHETNYGSFGKKIDAFDDEMERQLQEAMGGSTL